MSDDVHTPLSLGQQLATYGAATWLWVAGLSLLGGIANFVAKVKRGVARWFNVAELFGECVISGFVGVVTFLITDGHVPPPVQAAMVAIAGHMGTRAIFLFEQVLSKRLLGEVVAIPDDPAEATTEVPPAK